MFKVSHKFVVLSCFPFFRPYFDFVFLFFLSPIKPPHSKLDLSRGNCSEETMCLRSHVHFQPFSSFSVPSPRERKARHMHSEKLGSTLPSEAAKHGDGPGLQAVSFHPQSFKWEQSPTLPSFSLPIPHRREEGRRKQLCPSHVVGEREHQQKWVKAGPPGRWRRAACESTALLLEQKCVGHCKDQV